MCGVGPKHIRQLCDNPWEGGFGYTPTEVGRLTLDQIYMLFCKKDLLRDGRKERVSSMAPLEVQPAKDGLLRGRAEDGTPIVARRTGKSLARQLIEEEKRKQEAAEAAAQKDAGKTARQKRIEERRLRIERRNRGASSASN